MPTFTYIVKDEAGKTVKEVVTADDRFAVYEIARGNGHTVDTIEEKRRLSLQGLLNVQALEVAMSRVKQDELVMVTRNLGSMLDAGLPLSRALSVIERQSKNPKLKQITTDIVERINKGDSLYQTLEGHPKVFGNLYVAMVRAGEESGGLSESLGTLSIQMERSTSLKKKIKGAMIYPAIVITILVIIGVLMMIYVMPSITGTFKELEVELPITTKVLIATSDFMVANTVLFIVGLATFIAGFVY